MDVEFAEEDLRRLLCEVGFSNGLGPAVVRGYRKVLGIILAATDMRDLFALRSLRFEKLKGKRSGQWSLRLNDQWRLIVEIDEESAGKRVRIIEIVDYH
jgi:proteic killer suppression protein